MVLLTYKKSLKQNKKRSVDNHARKHRGFMQISINSSVECTFFSHIHRNKSKRGRHVGTSWQGETSSKMMQARQEFKQDKKASKTRQRSLLSDTNVPYWRVCVHNCVSQILKTVTDGKLIGNSCFQLRSVKTFQYDPRTQQAAAAAGYPGQQGKSK